MAAVKRCYRYDLVYKTNGEELQLEQVRASLPQYKYKPRPNENLITVACYQKEKVYSSTGELQLEQVRAMLPQYQLPQHQPCDMELTEILLNPKEDDIKEMKTSLLQDKENHYSDEYVYTPNNGLSFKNSKDIHTRLNFTDADSTSGASFLSGIGKQLSRFNVTSNLEDKAKLLHSQIDDDFPITEIGRPLKLKEALPDVDISRSSFQDESNFSAFHDSMQTSATSFKKSCSRKPLQELPLKKDFSLQSSVGVNEDIYDESSFIPYHDSAYSPPRAMKQPVSDITFTQIDIAHPKRFDSVSTPKIAHQQKDLSADLSAIPVDIDDTKGNPLQTQATRHRLSPIKEEPSGSSKLTLSSRSSNSSTNSCQSVSASSPCNPFLPDVVNRMLNSLGGVPQTVIQSYHSPMPDVIPGKNLKLPGHTLHSVSLLKSSSRSYLAHGNFGQLVIKVHNSDAPVLWEITILNQLHHRLQETGLQLCCFQQIGHAFQFPTNFVTLSVYCPYGSLQDVIDNTCAAEKVIPDDLIAFFSWEMLSITGYLHQCGIIHAALLPTHFLISNSTGLHLFDFKHSIDTKQFPSDQIFVGASIASAMGDDQPWKWQLDYRCLAICIMSLISYTKSAPPMRVKRDESGYYTCSRKLRGKYKNSSMWKELINKLLNAVEISLHDLGGFLRTKANSLRPSDIIRCLEECNC